MQDPYSSEIWQAAKRFQRMVLGIETVDPNSIDSNRRSQQRGCQQSPEPKNPIRGYESGFQYVRPKHHSRELKVWTGRISSLKGPRLTPQNEVCR